MMNPNARKLSNEKQVKTEKGERKGKESIKK